MEGEAFKVSSGAEVKINLAPFDSAVALKAAIAREMSKMDMKFDVDMDMDMDKLLKILMAVDSSPEVLDALFLCLARSTYNGQKISRSTFDSAEARGDYYEIAVECMKVNIGPFFSSLFSRLSVLTDAVKKIEATLKS